MESIEPRGAPPAPAPGILDETLRALALVALCPTTGFACGAIATLVPFGVNAVDAVMNGIAGAVVGWLAAPLVAPLIWRRRLVPASTEVFGAALVAAAAGGALGGASTGGLLAVVATILMLGWVARRSPIVYPEVPRGTCPACGYDLRGSARGHACPECGTAHDTGDAS
jgi:hypothetical protein